MIGFLNISLKYIVSVVNGDLLLFFLMIIGGKNAFNPFFLILPMRDAHFERVSYKSKVINVALNKKEKTKKLQPQKN